MKMWSNSDRPAIEPPEIIAMPGKLGKNRRKDSDEPVKKKFGKATRKGRKMKYSVCKTFRRNKKRCPTLVSCALMSLCYWILLFLYFGKLCFDVSYKNVATGTSDASVGTSNVATETSVATAGNAATLDFTYVDAVIGSQSSINAGPGAVSRAGLSASCTPNVGCTPSASCTPCACHIGGAPPRSNTEYLTSRRSYTSHSYHSLHCHR